MDDPPSTVGRIAPDPSNTAAVRRFVRQTYGLRGTLRLHRSAVGLDLVRAPVNVALAPVFLAIRVAAVIAVLVRLRRAGGWLMRRRVLLETDVSRRLAEALGTFLDGLEQEGRWRPASASVRQQAVTDYLGVRSAVSEITTSLVVLLAGVMIFHVATPGVVSLATPVAEARARAEAVAGFPLGDRLGQVWYGTFPVELGTGEVLLTGVSLAALASLLTTFAGILADPLQVWTGTHRRRLMRMLDRSKASDGRPPDLATEHLAARLGDLSDVAVSLWRAIRG